MDYINGMDARSELFQKLKELKPFLQSEYSIARIGVFGSFSDGTYTEDSDIDILVDFKKPIGWKFLTLELFLEKVCGRKIDLVTGKALKMQLRDRILNQVSYI
jgi:hypothetical protein